MSETVTGAVSERSAADRERFKRLLRVAPPVAFGVATGLGVLRSGIPAAPDRLLLWLIAALLTFSVGNLHRAAIRLCLEWLPFVAIVLGYDRLRGHADQLLPRAHELPQVWADQLIGAGSQPAAWLQAHLWHGVADLRWYDYATWAVYSSHFFVTPLLAAVLWIRSPRLFRRYIAMVVLVALAGLATYAVFPAVPPWLASQQHFIPPTTRLTGPISAELPYLNFGPLVETGQDYANDVAAIPSLHAAYALVAALFLTGCTKRRLLRVLLWLYPLAMGFALVYTGEHYVVDVLLGWVYAVAAYKLVTRLSLSGLNPIRRRFA